MLLITLACIAAGLVQPPHAAEPSLPFTPPTLVRKIEPEYTAEARSRRLEGVTTLSVEITKEGVAGAVRIVRSLDPGLDARAVQAVKQWRFRPGKRNGQAVA